VQHREEFKQTELAQFQALFARKFYATYVATCNRTGQVYQTFGIEGRAHISAGTVVLTASSTGLMRKHRFLPTTLAQRSGVICREIEAYVIAFLRHVVEEAPRSGDLVFQIGNYSACKCWNSMSAFRLE
jgi:hypothetical protein